MTRSGQGAAQRASGAVGLVASLLLTACVGGAVEAPPKVLTTFLDALLGGEPDVAYGRSSLDELQQSFGVGAAVSRAHFVAYWRAHPLTRYEILEVVRLDRRSIDEPGLPGTPFFEVAAKLHDADGAREVVFTVDGEIAGVVNVEAEPLRFHSRGISDRIAIDGVATKARRETADLIAVLVLPGTHRVYLGDATITVQTGPLEVLGGPGEVVDEQRGVIALR